jgi:hypothetical protein
MYHGAQSNEGHQKLRKIDNTALQQINLVWMFLNAMAAYHWEQQYIHCLYQISA